MEDIQSKQEKSEKDYIKGMRDTCHEKLQFSEGRNGELADQFTNLEVQITAIFFAFMGFFSNSIFSNSVQDVDVGLKNFSSSSPVFIKISFAIILFSLIMSLVFGLIHIKLKEFFWNDIMTDRTCKFYKWNDAFKGKATLQEAQAFHEGNAKGNLGVIKHSPKWTWVMQTIFLGISMVFMLVILMAFLFN